MFDDAKNHRAHEDQLNEECKTIYKIQRRKYFRDKFINLIHDLAHNGLSYIVAIGWICIIMHFVIKFW